MTNKNTDHCKIAKIALHESGIICFSQRFFKAYGLHGALSVRILFDAQKRCLFVSFDSNQEEDGKEFEIHKQQTMTRVYCATLLRDAGFFQKGGVMVLRYDDLGENRFKLYFPRRNQIVRKIVSESICNNPSLVRAICASANASFRGSEITEMEIRNVLKELKDAIE